MTTREALIKAIKIAGTQNALAEILSIKTPAITQWLKGERRIPPKRAAQIEEATGVSRTQLCPDFPW